MSLRAFLVLLAIAVASFGLAGWAVVSRPVAVATLAVDRPLLPELGERLDEVATITVRTAGRSMTARRTETGWVLDEAGGYPVDPEQVRGIVLGLAEMRLVEAKTDNPQRLVRLELEPVDSEGAKSRLVRLATASGETLAEVVVGKRRFSLYGPGKAGSYVRLADSHQAWLADRALDLPDEPLDWLDRSIIDLPRDRIAEVVLQPGTADAVIVRRARPEQEAFTLVGVPAEREADGSKIDRLVAAFGTLSMLDVAPAGETAGDPTGRALFRTFDGLQVTVAAERHGEGDDAEWWLRFAVAQGTPRLPAGAAAATGQKPDAETLRRRLEPWTFKVSRYVAERFTWKLDDLLKSAQQAPGAS